MENLENNDSIGAELKNIYDEDQKDRLEEIWKKDEKLMFGRDAKRLNRILEIVEQRQLKTPADFFHAAMVLQHGDKVEHYEMAHEFAKKAADEGYIPEKGEADPLWLSAAAKERALMSSGKPQLYGTQIRREGNSPTGRWYLWEVDPNITDEERAKFHVRPLAESQDKAEELNKKESKNK